MDIIELAYKHHQRWMSIATTYVGKYLACDMVNDMYLKLDSKKKRINNITLI